MCFAISGVKFPGFVARGLPFFFTETFWNKI